MDATVDVGGAGGLGPLPAAAPPPPQARAAAQARRRGTRVR
jgi:hypothetical protein